MKFVLKKRENISKKKFSGFYKDYVDAVTEWEDYLELLETVKNKYELMYLKSYASSFFNLYVLETLGTDICPVEGMTQADIFTIRGFDVDDYLEKRKVHEVVRDYHLTYRN